MIGGLIIKPELCEQIGAMLSGSQFGDADLGCLYTLCLQCFSKGIKPDLISLALQMEELPSGAKTMSLAAGIQGSVLSAANAITYAKVVVERSHARKLHSAAVEIQELALSKGDISDQIAQARRLLMDLTVDSEEPDVVSYKEALLPVLDDMEDRLNGKAQIGIMTGLEDLDKILCGLRPGNLVIIAGKPGTGKTVMGTTIADRIAIREGKSALIFSLEMPKKELGLRSLAANSEVSKDLLESGLAIKDSTSEMALKVQAAVGRMSEADVRICDKGALSFSRICSIARMEHRAKKLDLMVVDYLTLITSDPGSRFQTRSAEIGSFTRGFKALAKELGIPIIVLAQFNRAMESRGANARPQMSDLRDSGEIEQDADVIMLAYRDDKNEHGSKGLTEWDIPKVRHAAPGFCLLQFQGKFQKFAPSAMSYEDYQAKPAAEEKPSGGRYAGRK